MWWTYPLSLKEKLKSGRKAVLEYVLKFSDWPKENTDWRVCPIIIWYVIANDETISKLYPDFNKITDSDTITDFDSLKTSKYLAIEIFFF